MKKLSLFIYLFICILEVEAQTWSIRNVGFKQTNTNPFQISVPDENTAWASGAVGVITAFDNEFSRTTDGGLNWISGYIPIDSTYGIYSIQGIDADTAYAVATSMPAYGSQVFKTTDGGINWNQIGAGQLFSSATAAGVQVYFKDAQHGVLIGDPVNNRFEVYLTNDYGQNWSHVTFTNMPIALSGEYTVPKSFDCKGDHVFFGTSKGRVFKSLDGGQTWDVSSVGVTALTMVCFLEDGLTGIAASYNGNIFYRKTLDGGLTWAPMTFSGPMFFMMKSIPGTNYIVSYDGEPVIISGKGSSYSTDTGATWTLIDTVGNGTTNGYGFACFHDVNSAWAGGIALDSLHDGIYKWNPGVLFTGSLKNETGIEICPNPVRSQLKLKNVSSFGRVTIYSTDGRLVIQQNVTSTGEIEIRNIEQLSPGIYFLNFISGQKRELLRFVKE